MTPLRTCGLILTIVATLFLLVLLVFATIRVLHAPVYAPLSPESLLIPVDVLVVEPNVYLTLDDIQHAQPGVLLAAGMSILVSQETAEDGLYIVDRSLTLVRVDCIQSDRLYSIEIGKHRGTKFQPKRPVTPTQSIVRHVLIQPKDAVVITEDIAHVLLIVNEEVQEVIVETEPHSNCLVTCVNPTNHCIILKTRENHIVANMGKTDLYCVNGFLCGSILKAIKVV